MLDLIDKICREGEARSGYLAESRKPRERRGPQRSSQAGDTTLCVHESLAWEWLDALKNKARLVAVLSRLLPFKSSSEELFDFVNIEFGVDPEDPDSHFLIFNVRATGEIAEISARRREWHRLTRDFLGKDAGLVRLMIDVQ